MVMVVDNKSKMNESYPYMECYECTNIACCPHPDVSNEILPKPITPENCPKKEKIILTQKKNANI
jgi:hypothetical protein